MTDYKALGLKIGLEIHRQLSIHKLFCNCPSELTERIPDKKVIRYLRAVKSELGEADIAAEYEMSKKKYAVYEFYDDINCLVELDEEPPLPLNQEALEIVLQVAMILKMNIVDQIQVMRKQVLDFSNTSGFQRTSLIALNGIAKDIKIQSLCLEEDAARKINETNESVTYRLDRLGIPLIEISTAPEIDSPQKAKEIAAYLGMVLKSTGKAKSGLGTIRQDLNISIKNGARVEIKGVQRLEDIPKIIENEISRQLYIIKAGKEVKQEVRNVNEDLTTSFSRPMPGPSRMYLETDIPKINITKELLAKIKIPELIEERAIKLEQEYNLTPELSLEIIKNKIDFKWWINKYKNVKPELIARVLIELPKEVKSRFNVKRVDKLYLKKVLKYLNEDKITKEAVVEILAKLAKKESFNLKQYIKVSGDEVEQNIIKIIKENKGASLNALMGIVMKKYRGKIEGKKLLELIKKNL